jgi:hypothetical protein
VCRLGDRAAAAEQALGWRTNIEGESTQYALIYIDGGTS